MAKVKNFHVAAKALILNNKKALLLENPINHENRFGLPGGQIDGDEKISEALKREIKEELGINNIAIGELIAVVQKKDEINKNFGLLFVVYKINSSVSKVKISNEHIGFRWLNKKEFNLLNKDKKNFHPGVAEILSKVL